MKNSNKSIVVVVLFIAFSFSLGSCKDDSDIVIENDNSGFSQSFTAKVNGSLFEPEFVTGILSPQTSTIVITGSMVDGEQIQLFVPTNVVPGEYSFSNPLSGTIVQAYYGETDEDYAFARPVEDKMQVTSHNTSTKQITGTFAFQADIQGKGVFVISDGSFSVSY